MRETEEELSLCGGRIVILIDNYLVILYNVR